MTQKVRVQMWLDSHESLNPLEAWHELGVYRLAAIIHELREDGVPIQTDLKPVQNRYGEDCKVAFYSLRRE